MFTEPHSFEAALIAMRSEGVARLQDAFNPDILQGVISPFAQNPEWQGTDIDIRHGEEIAGLPASVQDFVGNLALCVSGAQDRGWHPNYFMSKSSDKGIFLHPDKMEFRDLSVFAYVKGMTHFYYRTPAERYQGLVLSPGDLLFMRQPSDMLDVAARVWHGVGATGIRSFVNISSISSL